MLFKTFYQKMEDRLFKDYGKVVIRTPLYSFSSLFGDNNETRNLDKTVRCYLNDRAFMEGLM